MDANTTILVAYVVTTIVALGCVFLPGAGLTGRLLCGGTGVVIGAMTMRAHLRHTDDVTHPAALAVPAALLGYIVVTTMLYRRRCDAEWYSPAYRSGGTTAPVAVPPPAPERRGPGRRVLPGEFGAVPINHLPPPHDPWAALYASVERELLRAVPGRHRPSAVTQELPPVRPTAYAARKAAYAARQAEYTTWQAATDAADQEWSTS